MPSYKEQFNLSIFDYSPVGYCVLELVLDDKGTAGGLDLPLL